MAGIGSTNAMKKGSGNNPFLAFTEADMRSFLNSSYVGCIVKYTGDAIQREITDANRTTPEHAQNIVFKNYAFPELALRDGASINIFEKDSEGTVTESYIVNGAIKNGVFYYDKSSLTTPYVDVLAWVDAKANNANVKAVLYDSAYGWHHDTVNDQKMITLWSYSDDVTFTVTGDDLSVFELLMYVEPYKVGELYKVVYGDGEYYFEEYYYISEYKTTGNSDYIAPGKTMYDFTGELQVGNGSKVNPYIASTADEMAAYLTSTYKGAFVKYVGDTVAAGGTPAPVNPIAVGDTITQLYFDTTKTPDFSLFDWENPTRIDENGFNVIDLLNTNGDDMSVIQMTKETLAGLGVNVADDQYQLEFGQAFYITDGVAPSFGLQSGWNYSNSSEYLPNSTYTVSAINAQDIWGAYISKDGQWTSGGGESYVKNAVYQVAEDGDTTMYMVLPSLDNEGSASDLAAGKQLINSQGEVVEGAAPTQGDVLALYANKQLTEFVTDAEISTIGASYPSSTTATASFTLNSQSLLSKVVLTNVKALYPYAFNGCSNLTHVELPFGVNLNGVMYYNGWYQAGNIFPSTLWFSNVEGTYISIANWSKYDVLLRASRYRSNYSSTKYILAGALSSNYIQYDTVYLSGAMYVNAYLAGSYGNYYIKTVYMPNCSYIQNNTFYSFTSLDTVYLDNAISIGNAFPYCSKLTKVYCPNAESLNYAFASSPNLIEPYDFPNVKYCVYPYASTLSTISSVNLPEASVVKLSGSGIQSVYMPKVESLTLTNMQFSTINVPLCKDLNLYTMPNLENIYAPNLLYCSWISNCYKLTEISFESVIAAHSSYATTTYNFNVSNCSQLKTISLPNFSNGGISIASCSNLETVYVPLLNSYISIRECTLAQFSIYNAYSISLYSITAKSDFSIYANESTWRNLCLSISANNSERVDLYINNYSDSAYLNVYSISSNAIRNINISLHNNLLSANLYAGEHINIYNTDVNNYVLSIGVSNNSTVLDVKLSNCHIRSYFCTNCSNLEDVYNYEVASFGAYTYNSCSKLSAIIVDGSNFTGLAGANVFSSTPITNSTYLGYYGSIYVRNSMVDTYKTNANWKSYSSRITSITDLPQELKDKYGLNGVE